MGMGEGATWSHWRKDSSLTSSSAAAAAMAVFESDELREVEGAAEGIEGLTGRWA